MQILRSYQALINSLMITLMAFWQIGQPLQAATFYWDGGDATAAGNNTNGAGLGGTGNWDTTTTNWWDETNNVVWPNTNADVAVFTHAFPASPYALPTPFTVTLDAGGITANQLRFLRSGYTLTGGDLTLSGTTSGLFVGLGESATINSLIQGVDGLTKTGGGSIRLGNNANTYTGVTAIANGSLIITNQGALGASSGTVVVMDGNGTPSNTNTIGFFGGSLFLDGSTAGFTFSRDLNLSGQGPIGGRGAALLSVGNNTVSGTVNTAVSSLTPATFRNTRISSVNGTLTLSGALNIGGLITGTAAGTTTSLGGVNTAGVGNTIVSGVVTGTAYLEKSGAGTLFWNPSDTSGFAGRLRISASATGGQSSVRVTSALDGLNANHIFGTANATSANGPIDMNGGVLEIRSDSSLNFGKNVYSRANSTYFTGPAVGGAGINGVTTFGTFHLEANTTATFNSRNGYGMTFGTWTQNTSNNASTVTNNMGGTLTFIGNAWNNSDGSARTLTINGNGNTRITGSLNTSGAGTKSLSKGGTGNLTIEGTATALNGAVSITGGAITITDFRSLNNNTGVIAIGSGTTGASLIVGTDQAASAAGLTTGKVINLAGTTGGASLYANQNGTNPVIMNANFVSTGVGAKTLTLGGSNGFDNLINGSISNAGTAFTPNAALSSGGTVISFASTAGMAIGQYVAGTGIAAGTTIIAITPTSITLSQPTTADRAASDAVNASTSAGAAVSLTKLGVGTWVLGGANTYTGTTTIQNGVLKLRATGAVSDVIGSTAAVTFSAEAVSGSAAGTLEFHGFLNTATTETLGALTPTAGAATIVLVGNGTGSANLTFTSLGATTAASSVNFVTTAANGGVITLTGQTATTATTLPGTTNFLGHLYINGADFAIINGSAQVVAPTYAGSGDFQNAVSALAASVHNKLTGSFTNGAVTISSLVTNSQTLSLSGNLVISTGGILQSGGTATIQSDSGTARLINQTGTAARNLAIRVDQAGDILNFGTATNPVNIGSFTTGGMTKNGAGTLVIFGTNAQTGATTINEGTVRLSGALGRLSATSAALAIRQGATLELDGATSANATVNALDGAGIITNINAAAATITVGSGTGSGTWNGIFQDGAGVLNVTKAGTTSAPTWSGLNTYTGVTTIAGTTGSVTVDYLANGGQASGIGASSSAASNLVFAGTTAGLIYRGSVINGSLTLDSRSASTDRLFTLAGTGATLSSTASNNNAIIWSNMGAIVHGVVGPQTLIFTGTSTGDNTFNPQITDSGTGANITSITKTDVGQWNLGNANNTYTGSTTINNGILALNDNGALPANSPVVLTPTSATSAAILQMSGTFDRNLSATPTAGTGSVTFGFSVASTTGGVGFAAHTTELVVALGGVDSPTALTWGSGGFIGTGGVQNLVLNSTTALSSVDFRNAIDLGNTSRTINVLDNTNTGADYAVLSGALSGAGGGLIKIGTGVLKLTGANTYTGATAVQAGTLVASSLGHSGDAVNTPTSVGVSGVTMDNGNAITLGAGGNNAGILQYVGAGETSDRKIRFNSTTGTSSTNQIHADGTGALILTNVANDMTAGVKAVVLRGTNTAGNMITSQLSDNGGALSITVDGSATWILTNSANNYTGATSVNAGALGIGHDTAIGAGLSISNGNVFAFGGDRTIANALSLATNATNGWLGDHSLTFNGANSMTGTGTTSLTVNTYNSIATGETLTFNGMTSGAGAARTWNFDGPGETVINGVFTSSTAFGVNIVKTGNGILTLGTNGATSDWNKAGNALDLDRGTLKFTANNAIPNTATSTGLTISPELADGDTATVDFNGTTQTVNALTGTSNGVIVLDNTSATAATFRFGANNSTVSFGSGIGTYTIQNTGAGALSLVKLGNTATTFISGITLAHKGITASEGGGSFTIASPVTATTGLRAIEASTLALTGGLPNGNLITSVEVGGGSILSLLDGAGSQMSNLTTLSLGNTGTGTVTLNLNVGDLNAAGDFLNTDSFTLLTSGMLNLGNTITFNLTDAGLNANQTYTLLNVVDGGLLSSLSVNDFIQGATPGGFDSMTWFVDNNVVQLTTGDLLLNDLYWRGATDNTWNGNVNNWSLDKAGASPATSIPGQGNKVIFAYNGVGAGALTTTLEQNFKINSLVFESGTTTPSSVTINPGALTTARLEIAPQNGADGIAITTGGPAAVTIGANLRLGADQTWNVADAGSTLTLSGALFGEADVVKSGAGRVVLSGAADPTFNAGQTATFTVTGGNLEFTNTAAFGTTANSNVASIVVSGGGFYYNNATAGTALTLPHSITLSGGALSGGGATHVYGGTINVAADSTINMVDSNGPNTNAARSITLAGVVSGTGKLTIDGNNTASSGNQIGGTLTLNNAGNTWSGELSFNRGTVTLTAAASPGFTANNVTFNSFGRIILQSTNGMTLTRTGTLSYAAGAVGEFQVDNTSGTLGANYLVNQNGAVTLGSGGTGASVRVFLADAASALDIAGGVTLGGNSSISVAGGDSDSFLTISGVITDGSNSFGLAINDDAGGWAQTNTLVHLANANTYDGGTTLAGGTLRLGHKDSLGTGGLTVSASSTLSASTNLTGANAVTNALTLNSSLTMDGDFSLELAGAINLGAAARTFTVNGATGAQFILSGAITNLATADGSALTLAGNATGTGVVSGGIITTGTTADLTVSSGNWTFQGASSTIADDIIFSGTSTVVNLSASNAITFGASADNYVSLRNGVTVNLGANDAIALSGWERLYIAQDGGGAKVTLNMNSFNLSTNRLIFGERAADRNGDIIGTGTLTVVAGDIDLYEGTISANLASTGTLNFEKFGPGTVTLAGDNSGLASTGITYVQEGTLVLDYTTNTATKVRTASNLEMLGSDLILTGNASAAVSQTVTGLNLDGSATDDNAGANRITLNAVDGQGLVLNLGAINRTATNRDGTIRFVLPTGTQSATNGITTSTALTNGILGGFATVVDGTGTWFATKTGSNITALASTVKNDVTTWLASEHITDNASGFSGTLVFQRLNSLRFDAAGGSAVNLSAGGVLNITSGGILITDQVTSGSPGIFGGSLSSGITELIITHDSTQTFEISSSIGGAHAVTKSGAGTLKLSGNNFYTDETEILQGVLQVGGGNAIGDTSTVSLAANRNTTLQLLANETIGLLQGGKRATNSDYGTVAIGSNTLTINQSANTVYAGFFTGDGTLVMNTGSVGNLQMTNNSAAFTGAVVINGGLFYLNAGGRIAASSITINKGGNLLLAKDGTTRSADQVLDTVAITLNSADGGFSGATINRPRGLGIRTDQDSTNTEVVGVVTANSGANYVTLEGTTANDDPDLRMNNLVRNNSATLNVRGTVLGLATANVTRSQFEISDATNETAFIATLVGGGGAAGTQNISIVPWAIGESFAAALGDLNMGNSLVTYVAGSGFRPLDFATEYDTIAAAAATDNARASLSADLVGLAGTTVNALALHNDSTIAATHNVTGTGAGQTLAITSGALLFTLNTAAATGTYGITLGGFDSGITVGGTNEYVIHVIDPSSAATPPTLTATIASPLTSVADITKSGRGTLVLSGSNTAGGNARKTTINEGVLEITDLDNIGGGAGSLVFAGGTLRLGAGFSDDISTRTISFLQGGGTIDTQGASFTLANSVGSGVGGLTKIGAGTLTFAANAAYTGTTTVADGRLVLNGGGDNRLATSAALVVGTGTTSGVVQFGDAINGSSSQTVSSLATSGTGTTNAIVGGNAALSTLTVDQSIATTYAGAFGGAGLGENNIALVKAGGGVLTLTGASTFTGGIAIKAGVLAAGNSAAALGDASNVITLGDTTGSADATLNVQNTHTYANAINVIAGSSGALTLLGGATTGAPTLSGAITLNNNLFIAKQGTTGAFTLSGGITGTGNVVIENMGTTGTIALTTNAVNHVGSLTHYGYATGTTTISADIGANVTAITQNSATAALTISSASIGYAGPWTVNAGTLNITGALSVPGLVKNGAGLLTISNVGNTTTWDTSAAQAIVINGGIVEVQGGTGTAFEALGMGPGSTVANNIVLDGGVLSFNLTQAVSTFSSNRGIVVGSATGSGTGGISVASGKTVTYGGIIADNGTGADGFTKAGAGTLILTSQQAYTGTTTIEAGVLQLSSSATAGDILAGNGSAIVLAGGGLSLFHDGDGTAGFENITYGDNVTVTASGTIAVNRSALSYAPYFVTAANKTIRQNTLTMANGATLTVTNSNGYGLEFTGATDLGAVAPTFSVSTANTSLQIPGLVLSGVVSGSVGITKAGNGTLKLGNTANTFTGDINITNGTVEAVADGSFGNVANNIQIGSNSLTEGLRISGTFATNRTIHLNAASSGIDVTGGNTFTLNNAFTFATATNALAKNDLGTLVLTQAQTGWNGVMTINQGVLRIKDAGALGSTTGNTTFGNVGGALEIDGGLTGMTIAENFAFASGDDVTTNGVNGGGAIRSVSGANILTGTILLNAASTTDDRSRAVTFTADLGASLEIAGVVTGNVGNGTGRDSWIGLGGDGDGILSTAMALGGTLGTNRFFSINKFGAGTWTITAANAHPGTRVIIKEGTLVLGGAGTLGTPSAGQEATATVYLNPTGELKLDNASTDVDNRLSGRALNVSGADVTILGHAAGTTETVGAFTLREGLSIFTLDANAAGQLNFTAGALTRSAGATLLIRGDNFGSSAGAGVATFTGSNYAYIGQTGAAGSTNKGILPWALGDTSLSGLGAGFVTSDTTANTGTSILRLLAPSEQTTNLNTADANVNLTTAAVHGALTAFNSLRLGSGGGVTLNYVPLTLHSGGLLALAGNTGIQGFSGVSYLSTSANAELILHTVGDLTLAVPIAGTTGAVTKSGAGTLTLTAGNTNHGTVYVNDGILKMGGGDQTILPGRSLQLNHGGSLDLNGTVQQFNLLESRLTAVLAQSDLFPGDTGGTVINTGASQATLVIGTGNVTFAGSIQGNIAVTRSQASATFSDWNLYSALTYTGATLFSGGRTQLLVEGSLLNTSSVEIAGAILLYSGSNANAEFKNITNRINDTAPVTLRGGALQFNTTASLITTETMGAITLAGGHNFISMGEGGTRVNQWDLTAASLSQAAGSRATIRFTGIDATPNDDARLFLTSAPVLTNNIIGGWAVFEREFASYTAGQGVGGLGVTPVNGYAGYSPSLINDGIAADNIRIALPAAGSTTLLTGDRTINSLNLNGAASSTGNSTLDLGGHKLTLVSGGLIASSATNDRAIHILNGDLTAGVLDAGGDLYLHTANLVATDMVNRDVNVSANIVNNGTGAVSLVISGDDGRGTGLDGLLNGSSVNLTGSNTYTGGTWVNSGRVILNNGSANGTTATATGTGDVTISGGASTNGNTYQEFRSSVILGGSDQIAHTATVYLNGSARLNLNGFNQTIANLVINNTGGHNPEVTTGAGTLTVTGNSITASGQNASSSAFSAINGKLALGAATTTLTVHPIEWNEDVLNPIAPNLTIGAVIEGANIVKAGNGVLRLTGANAFTGNFDLQAGGLALGGNNALSTGVLTIGDGTFLTSTADNRIIANAYVISGNFALRDAFNLTLNGNTALAAGQRGISVDLAGKVLALGGVISGVGGINKTGDGILLLNNSNSYAGGTTVSDGILRYGVVNALPTAGAVTVLEGGLLDITSGGAAVTIGSLAGTSATQGGVVFHGATSGMAALTVGGDNTGTAFGGIIANAAGSTLNLVKVGTGTLILGGANQYNGATTIEDGRLVVLSVAGGSALGSSQSLVFGGATTSGILQLGDSTGVLSKTFTGIASQGSGTTSQIVSGNAGMATLTLDLAGTNTFVGNIGGAGSNEANLNLVKNGMGDFVVSGTGTSLFGGTTTVNAGKLFMDTVGAFSATTAGLTLADGTEFALRGTSLNTVNSYGFSGAGNVITVGSSTGATLGFGLDGTGNTQLNLAAGQTMTVNGTLTTAVYVNSAPTAGHKYVLINGTDANSLNGNGGVFELNPVIFNGGSFTYALSFDSGVHGGGAQQWVLTPTAQPALAEVWWKGDLTGLAAGVWSATLTSGTGFPSNWADAADGLNDALVPPDQDSIVHFSAAGAANFATTLGANMTIQALIFHTGNAATTIGSSNGINTLTLGNTVDASGLTLQTGVGDVGISAIVALAQDQSWNIEDSARVLNLSGGLIGTGMTLTVNDAVTNAGTLLFSGAAATMTGTLAVNAGTLAFVDTGSLSSGLDVVLGTVSNAATLQVGGTAAATNVIIGGLGSGSFAGSRVIGGNAVASTLTIGSTSGSHTFTGALGGAGANENNFNLVKAGAGTQVLDGALTYTGTTLVRAGTLQLGAGSSFVPAAAISVLADAGATAIFDINGKSFTTVGDLTLGGDGIGSIARMVDTAVTKGTVTLAGNVLYNGSLNGAGAVLGVNLSRVGGLTITSQDSTNSTSELTLNGTLTGTGFSDTLRLTFTGAGNTIVNGVISVAGSGSDIQMTGTGELTVNAATSSADDWIISGGVVNAMVSNALNATDDVVITGTGTQGSVVVNIGGTAGTSGVHQGNEFYIRGGAHVNVLVNNGISAGTAQLLIGDSGSTSAASAGLLNLVNANISPASLLLGTTGGQIGIITGTGILSTTGNKELRNGTIGEGITLGGNGAILKNVVGTVTFYGQRDVAATGAVEIREGELILDYTLNNNSKIGSSLVLGINSAITNPILTLNGSASAATLQSVGTTTIASAFTAVNINNGSGQTATLALGGISRAVVGGAVAFRYSSADAVATSSGAAGTLGWATVGTGLGLARLAAIDGSGNIVAATTTVANDVAAWAKGQNVINDAAFAGTVGTCEIESLTFAASAASTITIGTAKRLVISSGGILVSEGLGNVNSVITGGELIGGKSSAGGILGELIIHQNNVGSSGTTGLLTIASNIVNSSGITKTGAGILVLTGSNSFRPVSQVSIFEGTLRIGGGNAIGDTSTVLIRTGATLDLNNSTETIGSLGAGNGTLALGTGKLTINQAAAATFSGIFTGTAASSITKIGSNTLTFQGNSSSLFTGALNINGGIFLMSGANGRVGSTTIVLNGASLRSAQDQSSSIDRIANSAAILLNNTAGTDGLRIDNANQSGSRSETVGVVTVGAGHNVISATPTQDNTAAFAILVAANIARLDRATLLVRGLSLGAATGRHGEIRSTAAIAMVGGGGAATSQNISIVPWIIGQTTDAGLGNSFVTYDATNGLRPLAAGEYTTDAAGFNALTNAAASTNNVRFTAAATLTSTATAINSLLIDSAATGRTITGPANAIEITSGAIMAVANAGINHIITGWTAITTGGGRDYTTYVPADATGVLTIASALTSNVALVKSGIGILSLTNAANAFTDVYLNQGSVQVNNFDKLGSGDLYFFGGDLRLAAGFTGDFSGKEFKLGSGGGGIDTNGVSATATNLELTGAGDFRKLGTGTLTIGDSSLISNTGRFVVEAGVLLLNNTLGNSVGAGGLLISGATPTVRLGAGNQIADTAAVEIRHGTGTLQLLDLNNFSETIGSLTITTTSTGGGVVKTGATGVLTVLGDITMNANRVNDGSTTEFQNLITGSGAIGTRTTDGILDLGGADRRIIVQTTVAVPNRNDAVIETVIRNGGIIKEGDRTLYLRAANTYAGATTINNGTLSISSAANLGDSSATNTLAINHGATLQNTGANVDLGVNRSIALDGVGGTLQSTGTNRLTVSGVISGHDCADLTVSGPGLVALSGANTYEGRTLVNGGTLQVGVAGAGSSGTGEVIVASGATLAGSGTISGSTIIGGGAVLQAGDVTTVGSAATTVTGNGGLIFTAASSTALTVDNGGQIRIGISNTATHLSTGVTDLLTAGTYTNALDYIAANDTEFMTNWNVAPGGASDMDYINLTGAGSNVSIGSRVSGTFGNGSILVSGITSAQLGQVFNLLDWQAVAGMGGTFTTGGFGIYDATTNVIAGDLDLAGLGAGLAWDVSAFTTHGILVVVPEPSRALFLMLGLLGLMVRRRRR